MNKLSLLLALLLLVVSSSLVFAQQAVTVTMKQGKDAPGLAPSQEGTATLTAKGDQTEVVVNIKAGAAGVAQPAHIHDGNCPNVAGVKYPLTNVVDGKSTTTVNAKLADLQTGKFGINVHKSEPEIAVYVSCGDILAAAAAPAPLPKAGDNLLPTMAAILALLAMAVLGTGIALRRRTS